MSKDGVCQCVSFWYEVGSEFDFEFTRAAQFENAVKTNTSVSTEA